MVAAGGRDDAAHVWALSTQALGIDQSAAQLKGTNGGVVLMLHPHLGAAAFSQQRPGVLGRAGKAVVHQ